MSPKILVFGAGSLGTVYLWFLSRASSQVDITAVCRSNYDAALRNGFTVNSELWGSGYHVRPRVVRSVPEAVRQAESQPFDYIVVTAKALRTTPSTAELIRPAITPGKTAVVLIQNGIAIEEEYVRCYAGDDVPLLSAVAYCPATQTAPAVVSHGEIEHLYLGTYPARGVPETHKQAARNFVELLESGGSAAILSDDVQEQRWSKLLVNGAWNPICALTRLRDMQYVNIGEGDGTDNEIVMFVRDVMLEIASIAQACGYESINERTVDYQIARATARSGDGIEPSMLADALAQRTLEVESIVGNAVLIAQVKNVPVPLLRTIYLLAKGLSASYALKK
ncbi:2-dehydropantoate 2-reductase [Xylariaceae sp. FL0594]|nr:2-dehydropantoate 2-reductase [Xylariaceae sp. FL0594]